MQKVLLATDKWPGFPWEAILAATICVLLISPLRAQDDNSAPPPPSDSSAQAPDSTMASPTPPEDGSAGPDADNDTPDDSASFQTFYDALGSQGTWIQSSDYGYVWQPQVNDPDWAPYTDGHWVYTDAGWTWASDESFGWATYHYGRWVNIDGTGWCWVPGYTWAPAWVSWRYGDGYAGWAPLPPDSFVGVDYSDDDSFDLDVGFHIGGDCDGFFGIGPGCYIFLPINCLGYRHYHGYFRNRGDNFALINRTTNVTNINVARSGAGARSSTFHRVTAGGPMLAQVNAASTTPVQRVNLVRSNRPGGGTVSENSLALYAPHVNPGTENQPSRVAGSIGHATINRGTDIMQPLAVNARFSPSPATEAQVQEARIAGDHAPASAKVLTDSSTVRPILQTPLTSLKPIARQSAPPTTFNTAPSSTFQNQRTQSAPIERTYPQTGGNGEIPSRVYYPGPVYPQGPSNYQPRSTTPGGTGNQPESRTFVRPVTPSASPQTAPAVHQSSGGSSSGGGGYSNGGGGYHGGGGGGGGGGGYHGGGNSSQSH